MDPHVILFFGINKKSSPDQFKLSLVHNLPLNLSCCTELQLQTWYFGGRLYDGNYPMDGACGHRDCGHNSKVPLAGTSPLRQLMRVKKNAIKPFSVPRCFGEGKACTSHKHAFLDACCSIVSHEIMQPGYWVKYVSRFKIIVL